jgi:hypothetical protein
MGLIRTEKESGDWFIACKQWAEDDTLTWEARGLLAYLFAKPDDWEVSMVDLVRSGPCEKYKLRRILEELEEVGYADRVKQRADDGTFQWTSTIRERPSPTSSGMEAPHDGQDRGYTKEPSPTKDTEESSGGSEHAPARELPEWLFPLYDVYRPDMEQALEDYAPDEADAFVMNQWGQTGISSAVIRLKRKHGWPLFVAGIVITANEANNPNPRYLDTLLTALSDLDELDHDPDVDKQEQQSDLERLWNAARSA